MDTWFKAEKRDNGEGHIAIFSDIGAWGVSASDFRRQLDAIGKVDTLNVAIGSNGGDVFTGFQIYNMLARHDARKIVTIEGIAASMASVIAMAGDEVVMPENSMIMIHNPFGGVVGEADEVKSFGEAIVQDASQHHHRVSQPHRPVREGSRRDDGEGHVAGRERGEATRFRRSYRKARRDRQSNRCFEVFKRPGRFRAGVNPESAMTTDTKDAPKAKTEAEIRAAMLAHAKEVRSLCVLSGFPAMADKLIEDDADLPKVIAALNAAKAEKDEADAKASKGKKPVGELRTSAPADGGDAGADLDPDAIFAKWNSAGRR
jgi:ATP-dependent protease ClpP protease subunit